jgi:hypothetical protein
MKTSNHNAKRILWAALVLFQYGILHGQSPFTISGQIMDEQDQSVSYANITLYNRSDSSFISGTISDQDGKFKVSHTKQGHFYLAVSFVGFESIVKEVYLQTQSSVSLGTIRLMEERIELAEARVTAERIKAKKEVDKTTFFVNSQMCKASATTMDLIQFIPGIQVDLFRNISLEGKSNILILVNGMERSAEFLSQLDPKRIDKVEIDDHPGAEFRTDVSGVINIILKEGNNRGISGHVYSEIPVKPNELYAFPTANINLSLKKIELFASYDGELSYFDIEGINNRSFTASALESTISKTGIKQQEYWSHKLHYGIDYQLNQHNQLSFYGYVNPWSQEFDGAIKLEESEGDSILNSREGKQDDTNRSRMVFGTVYYKHLFRRPGSHLSLDLNYYKYRGQTARLFTEENGVSHLNSSLPLQEAVSARLDIRVPLGENLVIQAGAREMRQEMSDEEGSSFHHRELVSAAYTSLSFAGEKIQLNAGLRMEHAAMNLETRSSIATLLPHVSAKIDFTEKRNLRLTYRKTIERPTIYQLNPNINGIDPYTSFQGNPRLTPAMHHELSLDYSVLVKNNYLSLGAFFTQSVDCMEYLATVSEDLHIRYTMQNLGNIDKLGLKFLGSTKLHKNVSFNPFIKVYGVFTQGNVLAAEHGIENHNSMALESGFSLSVLFKHDFSLNAMLKYNSPTTRIQGSYFEDMLYIISLEKTFKDRFMVGITSALPFSREFTFQGYETRGSGFSEYSEDNIQLSLIPVWLKFKYSFSSGKKVDRMNRTGDFTENTKKKGLFK